jgi:general secretion pathway protein G
VLSGLIGNLHLPVTVGLASIASLGYLVSRARHGVKQFTLFDVVAVVLLMAIVTATSVPLLEAAAAGAKQTALMENLHTLRSQIELYRLQHGGEPPVLYQGTLPQLVQATDVTGIPGWPGKRYPYGPYLSKGITANALTGRSVVTATESFPPKAASGAGGWLYHQPTGQIAIDLPEMLNQ